MERAKDALILEKARYDERVCITLDHDFHAHLAAPQVKPAAPGPLDACFTFNCDVSLLKVSADEEGQ